MSKHILREQVASRQSKILNNQVKRVIRVLDARDGNITNVVNNAWEDRLANVVPQSRLELEASLTVEEQVFGETSPVLTKAFIERIVAHSTEEVADRAEHGIEMILVFLIIKLTSGVAEAAAFGVALIIQNKSWFQERLETVAPVSKRNNYRV